jgi:uncharacterized protein YjiS (DUF1127 family)
MATPDKVRDAYRVACEVFGAVDNPVERERWVSELGDVTDAQLADAVISMTDAYETLPSPAEFRAYCRNEVAPVAEGPAVEGGNPWERWARFLERNRMSRRELWGEDVKREYSKILDACHRYGGR